MRDLEARLEPIYEYRLRLGTITEYGADMRAIVAGRSAPPPGGLRVDLPFSGTASGRLAGTVEGTDYLAIRADGRCELDLRAVLRTEDGVPIALAASGIAIPEAGASRMGLRENVTLRTAHPDYDWVNALQIWAVGEADLATGEVIVRGYAA